MAKEAQNSLPSELSYEFYRELVEELLSPIEPELDAHVRYELYLSKLVYLENLQEQCFRSVNSGRAAAEQCTMVEQREKACFTPQDLRTIRQAIDATHGHLRATILEALNRCLSATEFGNISA